MNTGPGPRPLALDPEIAAALEPLASPPPVRGDWHARRAGADAEFRRINALRAAPTDVASCDFTAVTPDGGEILLRWYTPTGLSAEHAPGPAFLYLHGGSMILASVAHYDEIVRHYVSASGVPALAVDYRLAPECPHPTPSEDCYTGLLWLAEHASELGVDPTRVAVMGDSAGGALTAAVGLMARDRRGPQIAHQLLLYPMLDDVTPSEDPILAEATFTVDDDATGWQALLGDSVGGLDVSAYAAPARASDLSDLPPTYLDVGQVDILCAQDVAWALRLSAAGVPVELHVHPGANHAFDIYAPDSDVSRRAMAERVRVLTNLIVGPVPKS